MRRKENQKWAQSKTKTNKKEPKKTKFQRNLTKTTNWKKPSEIWEQKNHQKNHQKNILKNQKIRKGAPEIFRTSAEHVLELLSRDYLTPDQGLQKGVPTFWVGDKNLLARVLFQAQIDSVHQRARWSLYACHLVQQHQRKIKKNQKIKKSKNQKIKKKTTDHAKQQVHQVMLKCSFSVIVPHFQYIQNRLQGKQEEKLKKSDGCEIKR